LKIILGSFKDKTDDLVAFLEPRVGTKPKVTGGELDIDDGGVRAGVKPRHVKTYLKRFLFKEGDRKKYRVLVQGRELRLVELEGVKEEEEKKEEKAEEPAKKEEETKEEPKETKEEKAEEQAEEKPKEEKQKKKPRKKSGESD